MSIHPPDPSFPARQAVRQQLLARREAFFQSPQAAAAQVAMADHLSAVLATLEPDCLGAYWPVRSEFNAAAAWRGNGSRTPFSLALPFAQREPRLMQYRRWDGMAPVQRDECGIFTSSGKEVVPDVVLAPCVGFTRSGYRLGYGGGYFDRWLALYPHVTVVGVACSACELNEAEFIAEPHDQPLTVIVTEQGVVG